MGELPPTRVNRRLAKVLQRNPATAKGFDRMSAYSRPAAAVDGARLYVTPAFMFPTGVGQNAVLSLDQRSIPSRRGE
jgi:hypothetical protein